MLRNYYVIIKLGEEAVCWGQRAIQPYSWRPFLKTVPLILTGDVIKSAMAQQVITGTYIRAFSVEICDQDIPPGKYFRSTSGFQL